MQERCLALVDSSCAEFRRHLERRNNLPRGIGSKKTSNKLESSQNSMPTIFLELLELDKEATSGQACSGCARCRPRQESLDRKR